MGHWVWNVSAGAKFPDRRALLPHRGLADAITSDHIFIPVHTVIAAGLLRGDGSQALAAALCL